MRRRRVDFEAVRRELGSRFFIRVLFAGNSEYADHVVYEDELDELAGRIRTALAETGKGPPGA